MIAYRGITNTFYRVNHNLKKISGMVEVAPGEYFVGSDEGLFEITMKGYSIENNPANCPGRDVAGYMKCFFIRIAAD